MNSKVSHGDSVSLSTQKIKSLAQGNFAGFLTTQQMLFSQCKTLVFQKGQTIVLQGIPAPGVYIIVKGSVEVVARILGEGSTGLEILEEGGLLGGISFIEKAPSVTSAVALSKVACLFIPNGYFDFINAIDPDMKYQITKAINTQLCKSMKRTHDKAVKYISRTDMLGLSFIGRALHSVSQPTLLPLSGEQDENLRRLMQTPLIHLFSSEETSELLAHSEFIKAPKNCILLGESEKKAACFIVLHGAVQSSILKNNKLAKLSVIGPGALFAGVACIDKRSKFTINFITCESAVLFKLKDEHLEYFKQHVPILWYKLFSLISQSLVALAKSVNKLDIRLHIETYNR